MEQLQREYLSGARRKNHATDYFDIDDSADEQETTLTADTDDVDPLDAFMQDIDAQVEQQRKVPPRVADKPQVLNLADNLDNYPEVVARSQSNVDFHDSDEEVYAVAKQLDTDAFDDMKQKEMEVLAPLDHATIDYEPFCKHFYTPHRDICTLTDDQVATLRSKLNISVDDTQAATPVQSFNQCNFDRKLLQLLSHLKLETPTAIQAQALPIALSGRDLLGIAKTGSGKTLAFTLPLVRHVMDQRELQRGEGPIALILAPTRELAHQTYILVKKCLSIYHASCAAIYGGAGIWEQVQALKKGVEVVVATPGRFIEMIRKKVVSMKRVTFVVLDEADRMFEMGFEAQLRSIMGQIRPDRQTLMFSATFRRRIQSLALDVLTHPVKLTIGHMGQANEVIRQLAVVLPTHGNKWPWLMAKFQSLVNEGRLLIFANSKSGCDELAKNLATAFPATLVACLHGDKMQHERTEALRQFKQGKCLVLVATDVAARGLDVKNVKNVVNFDVAKNIDTHVHRIGRTGRMGHDGVEPGTAYTLVTRNESQFAAQLVYNMDMSGQQVPPELVAVAKRDAQFRRHKAKKWQQEAMPQENEETRTLDAEDVVELQRFHDRKKQQERKGLGFATVAKKARMQRVATPALASAFRSGFVKSTLQVDASLPATLAPVPMATSKAPLLHQVTPNVTQTQATCTAMPSTVQRKSPQQSPSRSVATSQRRSRHDYRRDSRDRDSPRSRRRDEQRRRRLSRSRSCSRSRSRSRSRR